jgi:hypothetical protein
MFHSRDKCIDYGAYEPEYLQQAIFDEVTAPDVFAADTPLTYGMRRLMNEYIFNADDARSRRSRYEIRD